MSKTINTPTNLLALIFAFGLSACVDSEFSGSSGSRAGAGKNKKITPDSETDNDDGEDIEKESDANKPNKDKKDDDDTDEDEDENKDKDDIFTDEDFDDLVDTEINIDGGSIKAKKCSKDYNVPGSSNLYLAGMPDGKDIRYRKNTDRAPAQSPVLVVPDVKKCLKEGATLTFQVSGEISYDKGKNKSNADGSPNVAEHELKAYYGKSNIVAPYNALLGVFLTDDSPESAVAPEALSYATAGERDYKEIKPKIGQIFYIGDGKNASGDYQKVIVPKGAGRLYFGIMDSFEWSNNTGNLVGAIMVTN